MSINARIQRRMLFLMGAAALVCSLGRPSLAIDQFPPSEPSSPWMKTSASGMQDVAVESVDRIWMTGSNGTIWFSADEGQTFTQIAASGFSRIAVAPDRTVWAVGANGTLWKRANGTWSQTAASNLQDVAVGPDGKVWLTTKCTWLTGQCSGGNIWFSADQGQTFTQVAASGFSRIAVAPNNVVWAVGANGTLWKWANGTWTKTTASGMGDVTVDPDNTIWLAGSNGTIWSSANQGTTFTQIEASGFRNLAAGPYRRGAFSGLSLWSAGSNGTLWRYTIRNAMH